MADKNYLQYAKQLFASIWINSGWDGDYMILAHEIPEVELKWFELKGILVKTCDALYDKSVGKENYPPVVFDVFYLFTLEFKKWNNIVYLDADTIVKASLKRLTKIKGFWSPHIVKDTLKYFFYCDTDNEQYNKLKSDFNIEKPAFNCGVMAFSTDIIKSNIVEDLLEIFERYKNVSSGADPTLNLYFYEKWKRLPLAYDVTPELIEKFSGINKNKLNGIIIHLKDSELLDENSIFYREWHDNLNRADEIDLSIINNSKSWSVFRTIVFSVKVYFYIWKKQTMVKIFRVFKSIFDYIELSIGTCGAILKKINSKLYYKIKKYL